MPTIIDLADLGDRGFVIGGAKKGDWAGYSVASAGDINGDGFADVVVGAPDRSDRDQYAGAAYVVFGRSGAVHYIDLANLSQSQGFSIQGGSTSSFAGVSVSGAIDFNNDGLDDVIVGAPGAFDLSHYVGATYVIFGRTDNFHSIDLSGLQQDDGCFVGGAGFEDKLGDGVSGAGDVNGDGIADLIMGAPYNDDGGNGAGSAYVIYGGTGTIGSLDLDSLSPADGFEMIGDQKFDGAGEPCWPPETSTAMASPT